MPPRSQAQKAQFFAMNAKCRQEGGTGSSDLTLEDALIAKEQLHSAESAWNWAQLALQKTNAQLKAEQAHFKDLYQ